MRITPISLNMANSISPIDRFQEIQRLHPVARGNQAREAQEAERTGITFADMLRQLIDTANVTAAQSRADSSNLAMGIVDDGHLHTIMINAERADLAFRSFVSVRNSLLEAYQEVMRINV